MARTWVDPTDLGLPFPEFRPIQLVALTELERSPYKVNLVQAPTGTGKTLLAAAYAKLVGGKCLYTCHTKDLQHQFAEDFPYAEILMGRSNYPTLNRPHDFPEISCAECDKSLDKPQEHDSHPDDIDPDDSSHSHRKCTWCKQIHDCPYEQAKTRALKSELCITNTSYFLLEANHVGRLSNWDLVVLDEGDLIEEALMGYVEIEFSHRLLHKLKLSIPAFKGTTENHQRKAAEWGGWLDTEVIPALDTEILQQQQAIAGWDKPRGREYARELKRLAFLERMYANTMQMSADLHVNPQSWVRVDDTSLRFKPVKVARFADKYLWSHGKKFLVMSGSLVSKAQFCVDLGLDPAEVGWIDLPCTFPVSHRPIYVTNTVAVNFKNKDHSFAELVKAIDIILDAYPDCRVLIHTHTYELARYVYGFSNHSERMVVYLSATERADAIVQYKTTPNSVLIAPSLERGISFNDDLCRAQIVCKVPYPNLKDRQVNARFKEPWYRVQTVRALLQMTGRGVRSDEDWCDTYILDSEFPVFYRGDRKAKRWPAMDLFPKWWREAVTLNSQAVKAALERGTHRAG